MEKNKANKIIKIKVINIKIGIFKVKKYRSRGLTIERFYIIRTRKGKT